MLLVCPEGCASMAMTCSQPEVRCAAGRTVFISFWVETITALAPLSSRMCWWSRSVLVVYVGTVTQPAAITARSAMHHSGRFSLTSITMSPRRRPSLRSACASRDTVSAASRQPVGCHVPAFFAHRKGASPFSAARVKNMVTRFGKCSNARIVLPPPMWLIPAVAAAPPHARSALPRRSR